MKHSLALHHVGLGVSYHLAHLKLLEADQIDRAYNFVTWLAKKLPLTAMVLMHGFTAVVAERRIVVRQKFLANFAHLLGFCILSCFGLLLLEDLVFYREVD